MNMEVTQDARKLDNGCMVWSVKGRLGISNAEQVHKFGEDLMDREEKLVMDMSGMDYISSAGLRVLLLLVKRAKKEGKEFTAMGASGYVKTVLFNSNMDTKLNLKDSIDDL